VEVFGWERWINEHHFTPWLFYRIRLCYSLSFSDRRSRS
jgi:hypothetical protein